MRQWATGRIKDLLLEAVHNHDAVTVLRIVTEQIEATEGEEKAYWLTYRASAKHTYGHAGNRASSEADLAEARRLCPDDLDLSVLTVLNEATRSQRLDEINKIPRHLRHAVRRDLYGNWRFWHNVGWLQRLRRRFHKSYIACTRAVELFRDISPEERETNAGWAIPLHCLRAQAALRVGRVDVAAIAVAVATEINGEKERKHLNPLFLAFAKAELALAEGQYRTAIAELQFGRNRVAELQLPSRPWDKIECELIAARIARADGNLTAFQFYCERALALAIDNNLPLTEVDVRAVLNGAPF